MDNMFTVPQLKERGWTLTLIKTFLPTHDDTRPNPTYKNAGAPMKLYEKKRVLKVEKSGKFKKAKAQADPRKLAAQKGLKTKQEKMAAFLTKLENEIKVPVFPKAKLIELALENFRTLHYADSAEISDEKMCVNYLRHCGTAYETLLEEIAGKTGCDHARYYIKEMVLYKIEFTYDWLAEECHWQREASRKKQALTL